MLVCALGLQPSAKPYDGLGRLYNGREQIGHGPSSLAPQWTGSMDSGLILLMDWGGCTYGRREILLTTRATMD
eukprot:4354852-Lingulodinium_polyedra.AAC.1